MIRKTIVNVGLNSDNLQVNDIEEVSEAEVFEAEQKLDEINEDSDFLDTSMEGIEEAEDLVTESLAKIEEQTLAETHTLDDEKDTPVQLDAPVVDVAAESIKILTTISHIEGKLGGKRGSLTSSLNFGNNALASSKEELKAGLLGLKDTLKKAGTAIKDFFKMLWAKIKDFFNLFASKLGFGIVGKMKKCLSEFDKAYEALGKDNNKFLEVTKDQKERIFKYAMEDKDEKVNKVSREVVLQMALNVFLVEGGYKFTDLHDFVNGLSISEDGKITSSSLKLLGNSKKIMMRYSSYVIEGQEALEGAFGFFVLPKAKLDKDNMTFNLNVMVMSGNANDLKFKQATLKFGGEGIYSMAKNSQASLVMKQGYHATRKHLLNVIKEAEVEVRKSNQVNATLNKFIAKAENITAKLNTQNENVGTESDSEKSKPNVIMRSLYAIGQFVCNGLGFFWYGVALVYFGLASFLTLLTFGSNIISRDMFQNADYLKNMREGN